MFAEVLNHDEVLDFHTIWKSKPEMRNDIVRKLYYMMPIAIGWITDICMLRGITYISSHMRQMLKLYSIFDTNGPRLGKREIFEYHALVTRDLTELEIQANIYMYFHKAVTNYFSKRKPKSQISKYVEKHIMYMFRDWFRGAVRKLRNTPILETYDEEGLYNNSYYSDEFRPNPTIVAKDWRLYSEVSEPGVMEKSRVARILSGETIREIKQETIRYNIKQ